MYGCCKHKKNPRNQINGAECYFFFAYGATGGVPSREISAKHAQKWQNCKYLE
jgi:hypothetical protein